MELYICAFFSATSIVALLFFILSALHGQRKRSKFRSAANVISRMNDAVVNAKTEPHGKLLIGWVLFTQDHTMRFLTLRLFNQYIILIPCIEYF